MRFPFYLIGFASLLYAENSTQKLLAKGLRPDQIEGLRKAGLLVDIPETGAVSDAGSDPIGFGFKAALADAVVRGKIVDIDHLYKEGGPFRTEYTIKIAEPLLGNVTAQTRTVKVLDRSGPIVRDNSRWRRGEFGIELEVGDAGIFILENRTIRHLNERFPQKSALLNGRYVFEDGLRGVYLEKNGEFDPAFITASKKPANGPNRRQAAEILAKIKSELGQKEE